jgi:four helix bundle protein
MVPVPGAGACAECRVPVPRAGAKGRCRALEQTLLNRRAMAGVRRYEDLECWKLANELKIGVYGLVDTSRARHDFAFRDQIKRSASSGTSNLAEAFGHYRHKESARYARIAKASLVETHNHLNDGIVRKYWTAADAERFLTLATLAVRATTGWIRYLEASDPPPG